MSIPLNYWHMRHSCGHAVYWSNADVAVLFAPYPCPWCGGEAGTPAKPDAELIRQGNLYAFRNVRADGGVPASVDQDINAPVYLHHMRDGSCCGEVGHG